MYVLDVGGRLDCLPEHRANIEHLGVWGETGLRVMLAADQHQLAILGDGQEVLTRASTIQSAPTPTIVSGYMLLRDTDGKGRSVYFGPADGDHEAALVRYQRALGALAEQLTPSPGLALEEDVESEHTWNISGALLTAIVTVVPDGGETGISQAALDVAYIPDALAGVHPDVGARTIKTVQKASTAIGRLLAKPRSVSVS